MAKWEYAAIVGGNTSGWMLAKPPKGKGATFMRFQTGSANHALGISWQIHPKKIREYEAAVVRNKGERESNSTIDEQKLTGVPEILFESNDILVLINMAGADGWEITGGIGYGDSRPGLRDKQEPQHETRWRIMRREL